MTAIRLPCKSFFSQHNLAVNTNLPFEYTPHFFNLPLPIRFYCLLGFLATLLSTVAVWITVNFVNCKLIVTLVWPIYKNNKKSIDENTQIKLKA